MQLVYYSVEDMSIENAFSNLATGNKPLPVANPM